jgi:1-acyl-sn-glycerol-3-phosphate acyltransferase
MRSTLFNVAYWILSTFYALAAAVLAALPGRGPITWALRRYCRRMLQAMHLFAGIKVEVKGKERLPEGAFIIAAKHHSWGDGFVMFANVDNLAFVTGDHLERIPLLSGILKKVGAIVVDNCGGPEARRALAESAAAAHRDGRRILIFPEGNLAKAGERFRYRTGVFYMYRDFDLPVVPVATNLGLFWPQQSKTKHPGVATIEFLDPIPTGLDRTPFLTRLEATVETRSQELIAMATGKPVEPSVLVPAPDEVRRAEAKAAAEVA